MSGDWCDVCESDSCFHLSDSEQAYKNLDKNISQDPLDAWICQHCPQKPVGHNICKPDCTICGGSGLTRMQWKDLKPFPKQKPAETNVAKLNTLPLNSYFTNSDALAVTCPHCQSLVLVKVEFSLDLTKVPYNKFSCNGCKGIFTGHIVGGM